MTETRIRGSAVQPLVVGTLGVAALTLIDPPADGIPLCPSAMLFGVACPLCGLTRSIARLVRGDVAGSLGFHPLGWIVLVLSATAWLAWLGRSHGWWGPVPSDRWGRLSVLVAVALVVVWGVRASTGSLPPI